MTNYRVERARIRLSGPVDGLDPDENIDAEELCWIDQTGMDANACGATPLSEFYAADYLDWQEDDKWIPAREGLEAFSKLLKHYERIIADGDDPLRRNMSVIQDKIDMLKNVLRVMEAATNADVFFCLAVSQ